MGKAPLPGRGECNQRRDALQRTWVEERARGTLLQQTTQCVRRVLTAIHIEYLLARDPPRERVAREPGGLSGGVRFCAREALEYCRYGW